MGMQMAMSSTAQTPVVHNVTESESRLYLSEKKNV